MVLEKLIILSPLKSRCLLMTKPIPLVPPNINVFFSYQFLISLNFGRGITKVPPSLI